MAILKTELWLAENRSDVRLEVPTDLACLGPRCSFDVLFRAVPIIFHFPLTSSLKPDIPHAWHGEYFSFPHHFNAVPVKFSVG